MPNLLEPKASIICVFCHHLILCQCVFRIKIVQTNNTSVQPSGASFSPTADGTIDYSYP